MQEGQSRNSEALASFDGVRRQGIHSGNDINKQACAWLTPEDLSSLVQRWRGEFCDVDLWRGLAKQRGFDGQM